MIIQQKCTNQINKCLRLEDILLIKKVKLNRKCKGKIGLVKPKENKELRKNHKLKKQKKRLNYKPKDQQLVNQEWIKLMVKIKKDE